MSIFIENPYSTKIKKIFISISCQRLKIIDLCIKYEFELFIVYNLECDLNILCIFS